MSTPTPEIDATAEAPSEPTTEGAFSAEGVDLTAIRWMLDRTPTERLRCAQDLIDTAWALKSGDES